MELVAFALSECNVPVGRYVLGWRTHDRLWFLVWWCSWWSQLQGVSARRRPYQDLHRRIENFKIWRKQKRIEEDEVLSLSRVAYSCKLESLSSKKKCRFEHSTHEVPLTNLWDRRLLLALLVAFAWICHFPNEDTLRRSCTCSFSPLGWIQGYLRRAVIEMIHVSKHFTYDDGWHHAKDTAEKYIVQIIEKLFKFHGFTILIWTPFAVKIYLL